MGDGVGELDRPVGRVPDQQDAAGRPTSRRGFGTWAHRRRSQPVRPTHWSGGASWRAARRRFPSVGAGAGARGVLGRQGPPSRASRPPRTAAGSRATRPGRGAGRSRPGSLERAQVDGRRGPLVQRQVAQDRQRRRGQQADGGELEVVRGVMEARDDGYGSRGGELARREEEDRDWRKRLVLLLTFIIGTGSSTTPNRFGHRIYSHSGHSPAAVSACSGVSSTVPHSREAFIVPFGI